MGAARTYRPKAEPLRTCVGCRERDVQSALLRFAVRDQDPRVVPDPRRRLPGRGVSVHPRRACLERAVRGGGFSRSLRTRVPIRFDELVEMVLASYASRAAGLLASALRTRRVALGTDAVRESLREGTAGLLMIAKDAAGRRDELSHVASQHGVPVVIYGTKSELGRLTRRAELGVLTIRDQRIASELATVVSCVQDISEAE